jgi:hypothetical protein
MGPKTTLKNTSPKAQSTHRVAIAGVHSIMMEKSAQAGEGVVHAHPLSLHVITIKYKVAVYEPADRADTGYYTSISSLPLFCM